ncbi:MAG: hypothetical protein AAF204_02295 [Pseudomonadota bacterium]
MYSSIKRLWDKVSSPFVLGGWLLIPFFGAMTNIAHAKDPDAGTVENLEAFYGAVTDDIPGSITGFGTFVSDAATDTAGLGSTLLSQFGVSAGAGGTLSSAFAFATGAATVGLGIYALVKVSSALFDAKPAPAAA